MTKLTEAEYRILGDIDYECQCGCGRVKVQRAVEQIIEARVEELERLRETIEKVRDLAENATSYRVRDMFGRNTHAKMVTPFALMRVLGEKP